MFGTNDDDGAKVKSATRQCLLLLLLLSICLCGKKGPRCDTRRQRVKQAVIHLLEI